jgi:DHA3 family macrolide efflux protein-like MFS transporter
MKNFYILWIGHLFAVTAQYFITFCVSVWFYEKSERSFTHISMLNSLTDIPGIFVVPIAGIFADRTNRGHILLAANCGILLSSLLLVRGTWQQQSESRNYDTLQFWDIYLFYMTLSVANAIYGPAFNASISQLVHPNYYSHANGMIDIVDGISQLLSPVIGGLLSSFGIRVVCVSYVGMCLVPIITLFIVRFPSLVRREQTQHFQDGFCGNAIYGYKHVVQNRRLRQYLIFCVCTNFITVYWWELLMPLILNLAPVEVYGLISSVMGVALLIGGGIVAIWGHTPLCLNHKMKLIIILSFVQGLLMIPSGFEMTNFFRLVGWSFMITCFDSIVTSLQRSLWLEKVPTEMQGRVFALLRILCSSALPIGMLLLGLLNDRLLQPYAEHIKHDLDLHHIGASYFSVIIAHYAIGKGRILVSLAGLFLMLVSATAWTSMALRTLDKPMPSVHEQSSFPPTHND